MGLWARNIQQASDCNAATCFLQMFKSCRPNIRNVTLASRANPCVDLELCTTALTGYGWPTTPHLRRAIIGPPTATVADSATVHLTISEGCVQWLKAPLNASKCFGGVAVAIFCSSLLWMHFNLR